MVKKMKKTAKMGKFAIYKDGFGFLTDTERPDFFYVEYVGEARTFKTEKEAKEFAKAVKDDECYDVFVVEIRSKVG